MDLSGPSPFCFRQENGLGGRPQGEAIYSYENTPYFNPSRDTVKFHLLAEDVSYGYYYHNNGSLTKRILKDSAE